MKKIASWLLLLAIQMVLVVGALEVILRAFPALLPMNVRYMIAIPSQWHPVLGVAQLPAYRQKVVNQEFSFDISTTDFGLKGPGFRDDSLKGSRPVVVLGDSFTWGPGVSKSDIWCELLEKRSGIEFANMAYAGYGTTQERLVLENWGRSLNPRGVILQIFVGNDFTDNEIWRQEFHVGGGRLMSLVMPLRAWLNKNCRMYELFKYHVLGRFFKRGCYAEVFRKTDAQANRIFSGSHSRVVLQPVTDLEGMSLVPARGWDTMKDDIRRIKAVADHLQAWFVVLIVPTKEQVYSSAYSNVKGNVFARNEAIEKYCRDLGVRAVDVTAGLKERTNEQIYWPIDGHLAKLGHQAVADILAPDISSLLSGGR
ncbi:MAG: hypothetical protein WCO69_03130 [Candidatus Omnitrophota bacterium]